MMQYLYPKVYPMARIRSPRRWWRDSVLAPLETIYANVDARTDALTDSDPAAASTSGIGNDADADVSNIAPQPAEHPEPSRLNRTA